MTHLVNKILLKFLGVRLINSQYGEDLIVESFMPTQTTGFYVDIGANHPVRFNNLALFYAKGWTGINIEPNPAQFRWFKLWRPNDINLNIGIGLESGSMDFQVFDTDTLSTFDSDSAAEYQKIGHRIKRTIKIPVIPLAAILEKYALGKEIDILSIDTEGFDMQVLNSNDWNKYRPHFIILETLEYRNGTTGKKLNGAYDPYLKNLGYRVVADTHINTVYEKIY